MIDEEFYNIQTEIRGLQSREEIKSLCETFHRRVGHFLDRKINYEKKEKGEIFALDAPCGYGNLLHVYKKNDIDAFGIDLDKNQINLAKKMGFNACVGNIFELPIELQVDIVTSFDFIEHVEKDRALDALKIFHRILKPNGLLIIRTPCGDNPFGFCDFTDDPTHKWVGSSATVTSILKIAGFGNFEIIEDWPRPKKKLAN